MAARQSLEDKVAELKAIATQPPTPETTQLIRRHLVGKTSYLVAEAAKETGPRAGRGQGLIIQFESAVWSGIDRQALRAGS